MSVTEPEIGALAGSNPEIAMASPVTAEQAVTAALRRAIREGILAPGHRLTQSEIASQLGVSRIPLRDALRRLEAESLVEIDGHKGARVTELSGEDVAEIYEMRIMLEAKCMAYAIANLTEAARLKLSVAGTASEEEGLLPAEAFNRRRDFYSEIYKHSDRPRMRRIIMQLRDNVDRYHLLSDRSHAYLAHSRLSTAIRDGDAAEAVAVLVEHISDSRDDLINELNGQ